MPFFQLTLDERQLLGIHDYTKVVNMIIYDVKCQNPVQAQPHPAQESRSSIDHFNGSSEVERQFGCDADIETRNCMLTNDRMRDRLHLASTICPGCDVSSQ